jgi:hypothetical protein
LKRSTQKLTLKKFRRRVRRTAAEGVELVAGDELVTEAEVGDLDVHLGVQQQIFGLQISVDDLLLVAILNGGNDLK